MRTLNAGLEAALNGDPEIYLQLQYCVDDDYIWQDAPYPVHSYKLGGLELIVDTFGTTNFPWYAIRMKRGAYVAGAATYETSCHYYVNNTWLTQKERVHIEASIMPKGTTDKYSSSGHMTVKSIIDSLCNHYGYGAQYENPIWPDWVGTHWVNIFYPAGRTLVLQSPFSIFTLLKQKCMVYGQDNNGEHHIYFRQWLDNSVVGGVDHPSLATVTAFDWKKQYNQNLRRLIWRDEASSMHEYPADAAADDYPIYNLGYMESTAVTPTVYQSWHASEYKMRFHLKYQDGDILTTEGTGTHQVQIFEVLDPAHSPAIYLQVKALPKFSNTEGGPLPATIEAAAPYTPLNVTNFAGVLDSSDNNLQAAMETIDDHTHDFSGDYAPASEGVTNGDSHDHSGGDGAQINHTTLSNIGTNTHAQIDTHIALGAREVLTANRTYYVRTGGNNSNTGLVNTDEGAFQTIQKAIDVAASLDTSIYNITIQISDGTYVASDIYCKNILGSGGVTCQGNNGSPANVVVDGSFVKGQVGTNYTIKDLKLIKSSGTHTTGLQAQNGAIIHFSNIEFGSGMTYQIYAAGDGKIFVQGNYAISGGATYHWACAQGAVIGGYYRTVTLTGTPAFSYFASAGEIALVFSLGFTFTGSATGTRYASVANGVIQTWGGGANYFPGDVGGVTASGGQYL